MSAVNGPQTNYNKLLNARELQSDPAQLRAVEALQALHEALLGSIGSATPSVLGRLFGRKAPAPTPRGLYIWGDVGRGKSMCMDLFFESAPVAKKRRVHFHAFMLEAHAEMHRWRAEFRERREKIGDRAGDGDTIPPLADKIASEARLLCFDEFQVTDVADAMILGRLFQELRKRGVVIVSTSNRPPEDLYKDGLNRQLFLPFIDMIRAEMDVFELSGPTDYRLDRLGGEPVYYTPVDAETTAHLANMFFRMTDHDPEDRAAVPSGTLDVQGRSLFVPKSLKGVAVFSFKRLCAAALGAADYLAIAQTYHTVILVAVPRLGPERRNEAKRFVTLVDALYENNVKLICSAEVEPPELYPAGDGSFEFERTVSRLMEMRSADYLARGHGIQ